MKINRVVISDFWYNLKHFFKNVVKWLPIIWKDRDWDHSYIMYALRFKIKNTADYIEKHNRYEGCEIDVQRMRLACTLITAINEESYCYEYQDYYVQTLAVVDHKLTSTLESNTLQDFFKKYPNDFKKAHKIAIARYNRIPDNIPDIPDITIALIMSKVRHEKAKRVLFKLLEYNIERWWD